jgi:hypothetical protein
MSLDPRYVIAPSLQEIFVDPSTGLPLAGGSVTFYSDVNRSTLKPVYELSGTYGSYSYTQIQNPALLSGGGTLTDGTNDILPYYFPYASMAQGAPVELYYIVVKDSTGAIKIIRQAYPNLITSGGAASNFGYDFVRNAQFSKWSTSTDFKAVGLGSVTLNDFIADDWYYLNDDAGQVIEISQQAFPVGASPLPGNPPYYLQYSNTNASSGAQTQNIIYQNYSGVQTLNGENVTVGLQVNLESISATSNLSVQLVQNFGGGGTPSTPIVIPGFNIVISPGTGWHFFQGTIPIPSILSTVVGTNSFLSLQIVLPINKTAVIDICNVQMQQGTSLSNIVEKSIDDVSRGTNYQTQYSDFVTGDVKTTINTVAPTGWLLMDDTEIGSASSGATHVGIGTKALYFAIWNNIHSAVYAPIYTSAGAISTYGASAEADWEANKALSLTRVLGRVLAGAAPSGYTLTTAITSVSTGSNYIAVGDATSFYVGSAVTFTTTGTLPSPLLAATTYYVTTVSGTHIQLSTTLTQALTGTPNVTLTTTGSPDNFIVITYPAHVFGSFFGEELHLDITAEMPVHTHVPSAGNGQFMAATTSGAGNSFSSGTNGIGANALTAGGNTAHNTIQTTTYLNVMIKL